MRNERDTITKSETARKTRQSAAVEAFRFRDTRFTCNLTVPAAAKLLRVSGASLGLVVAIAADPPGPEVPQLLD